MKIQERLFFGCWIATVQMVNLRAFILSGARMGILVGCLGAIFLPQAYCQLSPPLRSFTMRIDPAEAVAAGAQWKLNVDTVWRDVGTYTNLPIGIYTLEFKSIPGWSTPVWPSPVQITHSETATMGTTYKKLPDFTLSLTATNGNVGVSYRSQTQLPSAGDDMWQLLQWNALTPMASSRYNYHMPTQNSNYWVQLFGVAHTGFQFNGWSGSATGSRNPMTIIMDGNKDITAHFTPVSLASFAATHKADYYISPGTLVVNGQVSYPIGREMLSVKWRPILPDGWTLVSACGLDMPVVEFGMVVITGTPVANNPVHFNLIIQVPSGETGEKQIRGEITYTMNGDTDPAIDFPSPNPLVIPGQESPAARLSQRLSSGPPTLEIHGIPGKTYVLQQMADLGHTNDWKVLGALTLTNAIQSWIDTQYDTNQSMGFYRTLHFP